MNQHMCFAHHIARLIKVVFFYYTKGEHLSVAEFKEITNYENTELRKQCNTIQKQADDKEKELTRRF